MKGSEDASGYVLFGIGLLVVGVLAYLLAFRLNRTRLRVRNTAIGKADSVAIGAAALQGTVQADNLSVAPISGKQSAYWQVEVSEYKTVEHEDSKSDQWVVVRTDKFSPPDFHFDLVDASGSREIIPDGADMMLRWDEYASTQRQPELPPAGLEYLKHYDFVWKVGRRTHGSLKVRETRLEQGCQVYVFGSASEVGDVFKGTRVRSRARLAFDTFSIMSERLREAQASAVPDTERAKKEIMLGLLQAQAAPTSLRDYVGTLPPEQVVVWRGNGTYPFIISNMTQSDVVRSLRKRTWLDVVFGPALIIGGLVLILLNAGPAVAQYHHDRLTFAADKADVAGIRAAVRAGADINEGDEYGETLLMHKIRGASDLPGAHALIAAGADPDVMNKAGDTALIIAAQLRNGPIVQDLIAAHAHLNVMDKEHMTALLEAVGQHDGGIVAQLLNAVADPNVRDANGRTALIDAARYGYPDIVRLLIAAHADLNLTDKTGTTALQQAQEGQYPEVVRLLQAAGALK